MLGWSFCCTLNYSSTRYFSRSGGNTLWPASGLLATWEGTCLANLLPVPTPIYSCSTADFFLNRSLCSLGNEPKLQSVIVYRKSHDKSQNVKNLFSINPISHHASFLRTREWHIASACMITKFLQNSRCANLFLWTFFFHFSLKFCQCSGAYFDALTPPILPLCFQ